MKWAVGGIANNKKIYKFYIIAFCKFWLALNVFNIPIFCFCAVFEWRQQLILICMKAVCFIKWKKQFLLVVSFFQVFFARIFFVLLRQILLLFLQGIPVGNKIAEELNNYLPKYRTCRSTRVKFKLAKSSLWFGTRSLHDPWLTPDNTWDCLTNERKGPKLLKTIQERWLKVFRLREGFK